MPSRPWHRCSREAAKRNRGDQRALSTGTPATRIRCRCWHCALFRMTPMPRRGPSQLRNPTAFSHIHVRCYSLLSHCCPLLQPSLTLLSVASAFSHIDGLATAFSHIAVLVTAFSHIGCCFLKLPRAVIQLHFLLQFSSSVKRRIEQ